MCVCMYEPLVQPPCSHRLLASIVGIMWKSLSLSLCASLYLAFSVSISYSLWILLYILLISVFTGFSILHFFVTILCLFSLHLKNINYRSLDTSPENLLLNTHTGLKTPLHTYTVHTYAVHELQLLTIMLALNFIDLVQGQLLIRL